jgi:two-component system, chemotaxis family, response regulator PixH
MTSPLPSREFRGFDRPLLILLVDRDEDTRRLHTEYLRRMGSEVEEAQDGREALAKALARRPDAIVTATWLLGISGYDLCRVLRRDLATATVPIVVMTGEFADTDVRRATRAGATSVLTGVCSPDCLAREIQQVLADVPREPAEHDTTRSSQQAAPQQAGEDGGPPRRRAMLNHSHGRGLTMAPTAPPPRLICPNCLQTLEYVKSFIGGVSARHPEQWDYFDCPTGCGTFQYRHRTRKLRQIS